MKSVAAITALLQAAAQAAPLLEIRRAGSNVELKWPAADSRWMLQGTASLAQGPWTNITQNPTLAGGDNVLLQNIQSTPRFFRLACAGPDEPDASFTDSNCDGIDGDAAQAIFVVPSGGSDLNPGTRAAPMATLQAAMDRAAAQSKDVYAGMGTYTISSTLILRNGVSLYGQYDQTGNWVRSVANTTTISAGTTAILGDMITAETHVEGFTIKAANAMAPGGSSYGVKLLSCSGLMVVRYNRIEAGSGAAGSAGNSFPNGSDGGDGQDGAPGRPDEEDANIPGGPGGTSPAGNAGGRGGAGGRSPGFGGGAGSMGSGGAVGASGGSGGNGGNPGTAGANGSNASSGANGMDGSGGAAFGTIGMTGYENAAGSSGTGGANGNGGGGGGGGGGHTCAFACNDGAGNAGGGGGGGGIAGVPGGGAGGGGGSFGIFTLNANALISGNTIITKAGGSGGTGGSGGLGGAGGAGGDGGAVSPGEIGRGGNGGRGGRGGHAGSGGGGGGGPSIGLQITGGTVAHNANTYTLGAGGTGGAGGFNTNSAAPAGLNGLSAATR